MITHSSIAWRTTWTEAGCSPVGYKRSDLTMRRTLSLSPLKALQVGRTGSFSARLLPCQASAAVVQLLSSVWLCDPMDCSTPGFPVLHHLLELAQTHVHWVCDAIQPSHPLSSPSPPALNLSQYQGLFKWVSSSHQVAKILEFQLQHQSFQWIFRTGFFLDWLDWSPCTPRDAEESSPTPQFRSIHSSVLGPLYVSTFTSIHDYWND